MKNLVVKTLFSLLILTFSISCSHQNNQMIKIKAPIAKKNPRNLEKHGDVRVDNYYWLNQREDKEVISYLEKENEYYAALSKHTLDFQNSIFL